MTRHVVRAPQNDRYVLDVADGFTLTPGGDIPVGYPYLLDFAGTNAANALRHLNNGSMAATACPASETRIIMPWAGRLLHLLVDMDVPFPNGGGANVCRFTVRLNGVGNNAAQDTLLEVLLGPSDIGIRSKSDLAHYVDEVAGDFIGITYNEVSMNGAMTSAVNARVFLIKS